MKLGDLINCADEKGLKQMLKDLDLAGYHAVRVDHNTYWLRITGTPAIEYLVQARDQNGRAQNAYCETPEEAEEACEELSRGYEFVEVLKGYPGEWESVSQSW